MFFVVLGSFFVLEKNYCWHIFADTIIVGLLIKEIVCLHACFLYRTAYEVLVCCAHAQCNSRQQSRRALRGARLYDRAFKTVVVRSIWKPAPEDQSSKPPITNSLLCRFWSVRMGSFAVL